MFFDIGLTVFLVFLNGFFVASEFAIVKVRSSQIELKIREGYNSAKRAKKIISHHLSSGLLIPVQKIERKNLVVYL